MRQHHEQFQGRAAEVDQTVLLPKSEFSALKKVVLVCAVLTMAGVVDAVYLNLTQTLGNKVSETTQKIQKNTADFLEKKEGGSMNKSEATPGAVGKNMGFNASEGEQSKIAQPSLIPEQFSPPEHFLKTEEPFVPSQQNLETHPASSQEPQPYKLTHGR